MVRAPTGGKAQGESRVGLTDAEGWDAWEELHFAVKTLESSCSPFTPECPSVLPHPWPGFSEAAITGLGCATTPQHHQMLSAHLNFYWGSNSCKPLSPLCNAGHCCPIKHTPALLLTPFPSNDGTKRCHEQLGDYQQAFYAHRIPSSNEENLQFPLVSLQSNKAAHPVLAFAPFEALEHRNQPCFLEYKQETKWGSPNWGSGGCTEDRGSDVLSLTQGPQEATEQRDPPGSLVVMAKSSSEVTAEPTWCGQMLPPSWRGPRT